MAGFFPSECPGAGEDDLRQRLNVSGYSIQDLDLPAGRLDQFSLQLHINGKARVAFLERSTVRSK
jgi:hypothetical protein